MDRSFWLEYSALTLAAEFCLIASGLSSMPPLNLGRFAVEYTFLFFLFLGPAASIHYYQPDWIDEACR